MKFTNLFIFAVTSFICLIAAEMVLRNTLPKYKDMQTSFVPSKLIIRTLKPNITKKLIHPANGEPSFYLTTNSLGLRSNQEISFQIPEKTKRVLCLGDSYTFGFGIEEKDAYPSYLEKILNSNSDDNHKLQVINAGFTSGLSTDSQYLYLREIGVKFSPDLVILGFTVANDLIDLARNEWVLNQDNSLKEIFNPNHRKIPYFIRKSALFTAIKVLFMPPKVKEKNDKPVDRKMMERVKYLTTKINGLSREKGFKFLMLIISPPHLLDRANREGSWEATRRELAGFCEEKGIAYLDLLPGLETHHFFPEKVHFTKEGNKRVAEMIYHKLLESKF